MPARKDALHLSRTKADSCTAPGRARVLPAELHTAEGRWQVIMPVGMLSCHCCRALGCVASQLPWHTDPDSLGSTLRFPTIALAP